MHAISSYHGNRPTNEPTNKHTNRQDRLQYTAPLSFSAQCNDDDDDHNNNNNNNNNNRLEFICRHTVVNSEALKLRPYGVIEIRLLLLATPPEPVGGGTQAIMLIRGRSF